MDKKTAESYVRFGIEATVFTRKSCTRLLPFNIIGLGLAIVLFPKIYFFIVIAFLILTTIVTSILFYKKWSAFIGLISQGTQLLIFMLTIDCIDFAMYQAADLFVLCDYMIGLSIQIATFGIALLIVVHFAQDHDVTKKGVINKSVGLIAGLTSALTFIICKIFFSQASTIFFLTIISILMKLMIILLNFAIAMAYYRAFLIKKFKLIIDLDSL